MSGYSTIGGGGNPFEKALELDEDMVKGDGVRIMTDGKIKKIYEVTPGVDKDSYKPVTTSGYSFFGASWFRFQEFRAGSDYDIGSVKLKLKKILSPAGNVIVDLYATDGANKPTGSVLATGSIVASSIPTTSTITEIFFSSSYSLTNLTKYAIVLRLPDGNSSNTVEIGTETTGSYSLGVLGTTTNGGGSWSTSTGADAYFVTVGNSSSTVHTEDLAGFITEDGSLGETKTATLMGGILTDSAGTWNEEKDVYLSDTGTITETVGASDRWLGFRVSGTETNLNKRVVGGLLALPNFSLSKTSDQSIEESVAEKVIWENEITDTDEFHATDSDSVVIPSLQDGTYFIGVQLNWDTISSDELVFYVRILKNSSIIKESVINIASFTSIGKVPGTLIEASIVDTFVETDDIEIQVEFYDSGGGTSNLDVLSGIGGSRFFGFRIA